MREGLLSDRPSPPPKRFEHDKGLRFILLFEIVLIRRANPERHSLPLGSPANRGRYPAEILAYQHVVEGKKPLSRN